MKKTIFTLLTVITCLLGLLNTVSAQTMPVTYCPAIDTNTIIVTLDNTTPCNTAFAWRANGWQGLYNVYLSTTAEITATGTVATIVTNSTTITLGDFGQNVAQYNTAYYVIVQLQNARDGKSISAPVHKTLSPFIITGGSGTINCIQGGIITNVIMTRVIPGTPALGSSCANGLTYATLISSGLSALLGSATIPITWVGGAADSTHSSAMTWMQLQPYLAAKLASATPQLINLKTDTPVGGGALCQPCIATSSYFGALNSLVKSVANRGYTTSGNTLKPPTVVNLSNCVDVTAVLQW